MHDSRDGAFGLQVPTQLRETLTLLAEGVVKITRNQTRVSKIAALVQQVSEPYFKAVGSNTRSQITSHGSLRVLVETEGA